MKKLLLSLLLGLSLFTLTACKDEPTPEVVTYTVTLNTDGGSELASVTVDEGTVLELPTEPTKEGFIFTRWYETDSETAFDFSVAITADITLTSLWTAVVPEITVEDLINEDIAALAADLYREDNYLRLRRSGTVNSSYIVWEFESDYISEEGIVLPLPKGTADTTVQITATFKKEGVEIEHDFDVVLTAPTDVVIENSVSVPFENLTTEYEVADGSVDLYFEENGTVPYIKLTDFFGLLDGFIDPETEITVETVEGILTISYQYYSEEEDITYDMILTVDSTENTVVVNDPSFYSAYVYSTETNYGRHIDYDYDNVNASFDEGDEVIYDLDSYNMDIVLYEGEVLLPYYMTNQLFAGSSYYNVYYNVDGLFGIYSLPDAGSDEQVKMLDSSKNGTDIPVDLLLHTYNMIAFDLDYLYGLKDIMGVDTYYTLLTEDIDDILVTDPQEFEEGIRDLLLLGLDEPHTSYGYHSYLNSSFYDGPSVSSLSVYGSRFKAWYNNGLSATDDAIGDKWGQASGWNVENKPNYWFLNDTTVMLSLNGFDTADIEVSYTFDITLPEKILDVADASSIVPSISQGTKFWYYNNSTEEDTIMEILVKDVDASYLDTYKTALTDAGYTLVQETSDDANKVDGYYTKTIAGDTPVNYMVQVSYDTDYDLLYVSIVNVVPTAYEDEWVLHTDVAGIIESDSAVYMEMQFDLIMAEQPGVEDVILDLSWNTGGNVGALYRVVGFITDDAFRVSSINRDTNGSSSYYVTIDEGIPSYANLNWSLLTTPTTFSAANELATIFQANDLGPVIGIQSGGGACSITPILLPNGTAFTMSSNNIQAYRTGSDTEEDPYVFHNTEFGITPDFPITMDEIYSESVLLGILNPE